MQAIVEPVSVFLVLTVLPGALLGVGTSVGGEGTGAMTGSLVFPCPPPAVLADTDTWYCRLGFSPPTTTLLC